MTESEAIKKHIDECNNRIENISFFIDSNSDANKEECCNNIEILQNVINALEKQIPKKPYIQQDDRNNDCLECPSCDSFIGYEYDCRDEHYQINYCPCCGQAIDWSEEE